MHYDNMFFFYHNNPEQPSVSISFVCPLILLFALIWTSVATADSISPYEEQGQTLLVDLGDIGSSVRARAAEALGFLRYYPAELALIDLLRNASPEVRRYAALSLGSCGGRAALKPLVATLSDTDWTVAQSAWVTLTNLTGMEKPFDALSDGQERQAQIGEWQAWVDAIADDPVPEAVLRLLNAEDPVSVTGGLRALGALGCVDAAPDIIHAILPWAAVEVETDFDAKGLVQSGLRSLGRLKHPDCLHTLKQFLHNRQWAVYAAEALGDYGGPESARLLLEAFPKYAQDLDRTGSAEHTHPDDKPHLDPSDRILHVPYTIAFALSRIPFNEADLVDGLRALALLLVAQIPLDFDGLMVYDEEPYQRIFRHLLDRAGVRDVFVDLAFDYLGESRETKTETLLETALCVPDPEWHQKFLPLLDSFFAGQEEIRFAASPVMRGQDPAFELTVDVSGWQMLNLHVDDVDDYSMDRVNWADAHLTAPDGSITWVDTLTPVIRTQQHDMLRVNSSAAFDDLRIAGKHFERGLHTHAVSHISFALDGQFNTFSASVGVCDSRPAGQGSVRFLVSNARIHHRSKDHAIPLLLVNLWDTLLGNYPYGAARNQIAWEREDMETLWLPVSTDERILAERYATVTRPPFTEEARALIASRNTEDVLLRARELYFRSRLREELARLIVSAPNAAKILTALCRAPADIPALIRLLNHENHWVRINAAKTLMFIGAREAADEIAARLEASNPEADYGYFNEVYFARAQGWDELSDPTPRYREAFIMALGKMGAVAHVPLLVEALFEEKNALEIQYRAANALDKMDGDEAVAALQRAEYEHPYHSVRMVAREALWKRGIEPMAPPQAPPVEPPRVDPNAIPETPTCFVFIKGDLVPYNPFQMDSWRQAYMTTDSGPTYRPGRNLYLLDISGEALAATPLTQFNDGYVADCEVSYDGREVLFSRREENSPWWHVYSIQSDGTRLRKLTGGPYHDVQPAHLPDGRIVFSTSRLGMRDEYHGYLSTGLATMTPDGEDIRVIGFNFGRDAEPTVGLDGKILFTRLELFYSRMKTEWNLISAFPDGTNMQTLYGPERRDFWTPIHGGYGGWTMAPTRHRVLRLVQPRPYNTNSHLLVTPAGPILTHGRHGETLLREAYLRDGGNDPWVIATPHPLDERTLIVAAGEKNHDFVADQFPKDPVDLGLYFMDVATGALTLLYNDPEHADFEARPLHPRTIPPILAESPLSRSKAFTGTLYADSVFITQMDAVRRQGKLLRIIEGQPQVARHASHTTGDVEAWKNHGGAFARVLGTVPLAADGSFAVEVPADRLLHLQVLDNDRRVVGNQQVWMHVRPGERKGCIGCHEPPDSAAETLKGRLAAFQGDSLPRVVPDGPDQLRYRAKIWFKGHLPDEREERQRTVQSINLLGRN